MKFSLPNLQAIYTIVSHLSKREKVILYAIVFFVSLVLLDRMIIFPISSKMRGLTKEIQDKELDIKKNAHIVAQKDKIAAERAKYLSFLTKVESEDEEVTSVLKDIESLANQNSVYLIDIKPAGIKSIGVSQKYMVTLNCEAQMEQLMKFMYDIENSKQLFTIEKYQIGPKSKESSIAKCSMSISKMAIPQ